MSIFRKKSTREHLQKPLAERVQELIRQKEAGIAQPNSLRERLEKKLQPADSQQAPKNVQSDAGNIIGDKTTAPEQSAPQTIPAKQPVPDNLKQFKELCKEQSLAVSTFRTLIELLKNHVREPNENRNLLKYLGLEEGNLKNLLRVIMITVTQKNVTRNDIRSITAGNLTATNILFSKVFKIKNDDDEATMRLKLKELTEVMEPFDELMDYIEKYGNKILKLMHKIGHRTHVEKQSCSVNTQIEWAEELRLPEYNPNKPLQEFDKNDIEDIFNQISQQTVQATRPAVNATLGKRDTGTPAPAPVADSSQTAEAVSDDLEVQRAKQYIDRLITIFKTKPDTEELHQLGLGIDAMFPDETLGIILLALKNTPDIEESEQLIRKAFGLDDKQAISHKIQDVYHMLKDRFDLDTLA